MGVFSRRASSKRMSGHRAVQKPAVLGQHVEPSNASGQAPPVRSARFWLKWGEGAPVLLARRSPEAPDVNRCSGNSGSYRPQTLFSSVIFLVSNGRHSPQPAVLEIGS
jgi:hypothetical protein